MSGATLLIAVGTYFFKFPNNFTFGGITGLAVLIAKTGLISAADFSFVANMSLLILGAIILGKKFVAKTAYCSVLLSFALSLFERIFPMNQPFTNQPMLEVMFAIALPALGSAILFNIGSSSGGTDIIAMILKKFTSVDIGRALVCSDVAIRFLYLRHKNRTLFLFRTDHPFLPCRQLYRKSEPFQIFQRCLQ